MFDFITPSGALASSVLDPSDSSSIGDRVSASDLLNVSTKSSSRSLNCSDAEYSLNPLKATSYSQDSILSETYWQSFFSNDSQLNPTSYQQVAALQQSEVDETGTDTLTGTSKSTALVGSRTSDSLTGSANTASSSTFTLGNTRRVAGTLSSDTFAIDYRYQYNIFSGNGNIRFGNGQYDWINLSSQSSRGVTFNLATAQGGGVLYDPGNGARKFDSITLSNGSQILFENIDKISFSDGWLNLSVTPNDPLFSQQWNLHMMGVQNAWRFTTGASSVLLGIQDTGLGTSTGYIHPDLRSPSTLIYSSNYQDDFSGDATSHGTDVQGIIAASSNNGMGMSGINWNSSVFSIDVLGSKWGADRGDQTLAQATQNMVNYARSNGQRLVINMSLGGGAIDSAFEQLVAKNQDRVLFVIASGNDDRGTLSNPASLAVKYSNVIAVGASWGSQDTYGNSASPGTRISYPGWWGSNYGSGLTLMGPSEVVATKATYSYQGTTFGYDSKFNGTSAATPNVTGVASLVWSANSNLNAAQVKTILSQTAYDLGRSGYDSVYGSGFVNADAAVRRAIAIA